MERSLPRWAPLAALAIAAFLVFSQLASFGIWDPWEIETADLARKLAEGKSADVSQAGSWLVSQSFRLLGVDEWTGRLPMALAGLGMVALCYALSAHFAGRRVGVYAALIACSSPLFLLNARTMIGETPALLLQTAIALCASLAAFGRDKSPQERFFWLGATLLLTALGIVTRGALLCALPPIVAVATVAVLEGKLRISDDGAVGVFCTSALCAIGLFLCAMVTRGVLADSTSFSVWLGGQVTGGQPPTFDAVLERTFHAFAPWSALLPLGLARLLWADEDTPVDQRRLGRLICLWCALSYGVLTLFSSRYGLRAFVIPITALSVIVALFLREVEESRSRQWPAAIAIALLCGLLIRDFSLYPGAPIEGLSLADFEPPKEWNPKRYWAALVGVFAGMAVLGFGAYADAPRALGLFSPYAFLREQWRRGAGFKIWLLCIGLLLVSLEVFGLLCFLIPKSLPLSTLGIKWGKRLMLLPPALPVLVVLLQLLFTLSAKLRRLRSVPILGAGLGIGVYATFGFMPSLSGHLSPREVYESYNDLAARGEALIEYKVGSRAAAYYAKGQAIEVETQSQCVDALAREERRWAVLPAEELAAVDRTFRSRTGRHLFVADATSARVTLVTNRAIAGRADQNFLTKFVLQKVPPIKHRVTANFDDRIELLGYDLKLPHGDHVGAGESFELTWYWKAKKAIAGEYRIFVHIDANAARIHGDHDPVDGKYPTKLWSAGDIIVDRQTLEVPRSYDPGAYTIFVGFFSGDTRLTVKSGAKDDANRANVGVLRIR